MFKLQIKGVETIEHILNAFLQDNGFDVKAFIDDDFCYYPTSSRIGFSLFTREDADSYYQDYVRSLAPELTIDTSLISFFHELGHYETFDDYSDDEIHEFQLLKDNIASCFRELAFGNHRFDRRSLFFEYFSIEEERAATQWGIDYILNNQDKVRKFWRELSQAILNVYELNGIEA
jgi:hypothetical protein